MENNEEEKWQVSVLERLLLSQLVRNRYLLCSKDLCEEVKKSL